MVDPAAIPADPAASDAQSARRSGNFALSTVINHPTLRKHDSESIRIFLRRYDQYCTEIAERAAQFGDDTVSARPVQLKFCVDSEYLASAISLGFISGATSLEDLTDAVLRTYLDTKSGASKETVTLSKLDRIVEKQLSMNMSDPSATSRMQGLFISYTTLLRKNGLSWVVTDSPKVAVQQVLSCINPKSLRTRLREDLEFSQRSLRKDFKGFMTHAIKLAEAFQLVDSGRDRKPTFERPIVPRTGTKPGTTPAVPPTATVPETPKKRAERAPPYCIMPNCAKDRKRHYFSDCPEDPKEIAKMQESLKGNPADRTRSKSGAAGASGSRPSSNKVTSLVPENSPTVPMTVEDGKSSVSVVGQCDDGSDDSLVSPHIANKAVLDGIGSFKKIDPVSFQVALTKEKEPIEFTFSKVWMVPRTVLHLSSGKLAVLNISFLVADDDLTSGGLLIGRPVLQHMRVDTKTLLESNRASLDGTDCADIGNPTIVDKRGHVGTIMDKRSAEVEHHIPNQDPNRPRVDYFQSRKEIDPFPDASLLDPVDADQGADIDGAISDMLKQAEDNGLKGKHLHRLQKMVMDNVDIFRVGLSSGPAADITPLKIDLTADAKPIRVKLRNYSRDQRDFLNDFVGNLERKGMVYPNPSSPWACAPLLVPKDAPSRFRFTVDLRPVNRFTVKYQYPMPDIEVELSKLAGAKYFGTFDFSHGYWQLPLDPDSQATQSFITPNGIFTPTRVIHGTSNATMHMQAEVNSLIQKDSVLTQHLLAWLDDVLAYADTIEKYLGALDNFFAVCKRFRLRLHPGKCVLFALWIRWCGRTIDKDGIKFDPRRINGLLEMAVPKTGSELARINLLDVGWNQDLSGTFQDCKDALAAQVKLAHRDGSKRLCVFTDASDGVWSGLVTQVPYVELNLPNNERNHEPLAFLSGRFDATQLRWSILEKEAFAIMATTERMHWILSDAQGFDIFTDHNNLVFIFDPLSVLRDISISSLKKVLRWAVRLSIYNYTCIHIPGADNVWADLLSRWAVPNKVRRIINIPLLPSAAADDFIWPNGPEIADEQEKYSSTRPKKLVMVDGLLAYPTGAVWIPSKSADLQLRICIIGHTSAAGHRGSDATEAAIRKNFLWDTLSEDVSRFVKGCIHCISTTGGKRVPRPFGPSVHGTAPNDLLQFDFLEIGPGADGIKYILMMRDDFSSYCWLFPFSNANSDSTAMALLEWSSSFNVPRMLMSDQGTHFKNETVRKLSRALKVPHHFTLPHTPWSNGAVERLGKEILRTFRTAVSELQVPFSTWPDLVPLVQSALNNSLSPQRGNLAPITIFMGKEPSPPISTFWRRDTGTTVTIKAATRKRALNFGKVRDLVDNYRTAVGADLTRNRTRKRGTASRGTLPNFSEGDFVLVAREHFNAGEKLCLRWRGPRRIIGAVSDYVYQVEDLRNGSLEEAHASRLRFYSDSALNTEAIMSHVLTSETGMPVQRLLRLENGPDGLMVAVRWRGLPTSADTLEPIARIHEDVPRMLQNLLNRKSTPRNLRELAKSKLGL